MSGDAGFTAVDGRDCQSPELEVSLLDTRLRDDVHAQAELHLCVVITEHVAGAVSDVVHCHDRSGTECSVEGLSGQVVLGLVGDLGEHRVVSGGCCAGEERAPQLLLVELGRAGERTEVELQVLRELRKAGAQVIDRHLVQSLLDDIHLVDVLGRVVLLPVAGADLFGLEGIQDTQDLVDVTADSVRGHGDELDDTIRVDDEGRAVSNAVSVLDTEGTHQVVADVGEHRERDLDELRVGCTPVEVGELVVTGAAENDGVAVIELFVELAERGDLGRADEGEVLRVEEHDLPLADVRLVGDLLKVVIRRCSVSVAQVAALESGQIELGKLVTDGEQSHVILLVGKWYFKVYRHPRPSVGTYAIMPMAADRVKRKNLIVSCRVIGMRNRDYRPTLPQLRAFVAIADTGHFGQAARRLGISQPSLSQALATLEQGLDVQLVERSTRRVLITPAGRGLLPLARQVSELVDEVVDRAAGRTEELSGPLTIGFIPTVAPYILPNFLHLVREELPELEPRIHEEPTEHLTEALRSGDIDVAVMALPSGGSIFEETPLYDEEFRIILPEGHELAGEDSLTLEVLNKLNLLLLDDGHCMRDQVLDLCRRVDARRDMESGLETRAASLSTVVQCVAGGLGETLIPESAVSAEAFRPGLATARFGGPTRPGRTIGMVHRSSSVRGEEFAKIGELVTRAFEMTRAD